VSVLLTKKADELQLEDAIAIAQSIERGEQAIKLMKDKLKAYVELNGPVKANGKVWDYFQSSSWEFEAQQLKVLAGMMAVDGLNPYEYLSLSSSALKKLRYSDETLSHYGKIKQGNKSFRSVKEENYQK
jgi:hypothetical protein